MKLNDHLRKLSTIPKSERESFMETLVIKNYGSNELSGTAMWILTQASEDEEYLTHKLREADELSLDIEAPEEPSDELSLDIEAPEEPSDELSLDAAPSDELSLDTPEEPSDELSLDAAPSDELSLDAAPSDELSLDTPEVTDELSLDTEEPSDESEEIETSKAGIGILPLLGEIQDKLSSGKPSEVELAAIKALSKLIK